MYALLKVIFGKSYTQVLAFQVPPNHIYEAVEIIMQQMTDRLKRRQAVA